jgi:RimJ/RimL family protein N-acetyltransferase
VRIETERLLLRPMAEDDLDAFVELQSAPEVVRFFGHYGREHAMERLRTDARQWRERGYGLLAIVDPGTGRFLGRVGLRYWPEWDEVDVGWVLRPEVWGQGLATEAARACMRWGFETFGLRYVIALIEPANTRSVRVAERLGMAPVRREFVFERNMVVHSVSARE